ncbi:MAG TPA: SpoIID/LytB domain-containing protein [Gaiellaceae bacterium]|nr:SpoIID/LytB domain-containing protein [Gaiellaceae bacterium]
MRVWVAAFLTALAVPGVASAGTVFVLDGGGWGHGVGMSQWGAEGYAVHGFDYRRILAHYYPHTSLQVHRATQVRVLLRENQSRVRITSSAPYVVVDAKGRKRHLKSAVVLTPALIAHWHGFTPPLRFVAGIHPLTIGGDAYRGDFVVKRKPGGLMVVNSLPLDRYLRGVVPWEVPTGWQTAAYEAQAVAARTYTLATLKPGKDFDLYSDDRSQMYGGIRAERPETSLALGATAGQVLTYGGHVIVAYYSSDSGGRTAAVQDAFAGYAPEPYLVSVRDPYDTLSPHRVWPTEALSGTYFAQKLGLPGVRDAVTEFNGSGRVADVRFQTTRGWRTFTGDDLRKKLSLRSTYFRIGALTLNDPSRRALLDSAKVRVTGAIRVLAHVQLQRESRDGAWRTIAYVHPQNGKFVVTLRVNGPLKLRLVAEGVATAPIAYRVLKRS